MLKAFCYFIVLSILFSVTACKPEAKNNTNSKTEKQPNFLFIFTDDQSFQAVHALGNEEIITPAIDALVESGTTFTNAYNMGGWHGAVCIASRAMIISGKTMWNAEDMTTDVYANGGGIDESWPKLFDHQNYDTYMTGKWHVNLDPKAVFDRVENIRGGMPPGGMQSNCPECYNRPLSPADTSWQPYDSTKSGFFEGGKHWSEVVRDDAISFIDQASESENPFFMYVAFNAPHDPRQAPKKYLDMYDVDKIKVPENFMEEYPWFESIIELGELANHKEILYDFPKDKLELGTGDLRDELLAPFPRTHYAVKKHRQEYYAIVTHLDDQIKKIVDELKEKKLYENTYIIFTSDHGLSVGQHGMIGKQSLLEHSAKVPLVILGPGIQKNKKIETPVYLQDAMPTSLELANIEIPEHVEFKSLVGLMHGNETDHYSAIYGAYRTDRQRMIVKNNFKLLLYPLANQILLYDLKNDPLEMNNLAKQEDYRETIQEMYGELKQLQIQMNDPYDLDQIFARILQ